MARSSINIVGNRYHRLTVVRRASLLTGDPMSGWLCICDCGEEKLVCRAAHLFKGQVKSCGCLGRVMTDDLRDKMVADSAAGMSLRAICEKYNYGCRKTLARLVNDRGGTVNRCGRQRTYSLDETVFDTVGPEAAYWIGFLMADGSVSKKRGTVTFGLAEKDAAAVNLFRDFLGTNRPICVRVNNKGSFRNASPAHILTVDSHRLVERLAEFGVVPEKTAGCRAIGLAQDRHFWRGCLDGDGWLCWQTNGKRRDGTPTKTACLGFCGAFDLVSQFADYCSFAVGKRPNVNKCAGMWRVTVSGVKAAEMANHIYGQDSLALPRKAQMAGEFIASYLVTS